MKTQLKKLGLGMMLAVLPMMATSVSAQWNQQGQSQGVVVNLSDSIVQPALERPIDTNAVYTVAIAPNGSLTGQVAMMDADTKSASGLKGLSVFFVQDGKVVKQAQTLDDGSFQIQGVNEGAYSFFAVGNSGIAAYGIYATRQITGATRNILEASLASSNYSGMKQVLQQTAPAEVINAANGSASEAHGTAVRSNSQVRLVNGRVNGQISSLFGKQQSVGGVQVHLIQDDQLLALVETNSVGGFSIPDLEPGVYDLVVTGQSALVVGRFEALGTSSPMTQIAFRKTAAILEFALTQTQTETQGRTVTDANSEIVFDGGQTFMEPGAIEYAGQSMGYGSATGGVTGNAGNFGGVGAGARAGGRGFRGGMGMRRLLMLGGGIGGIIAIADDEPNASSPVK